MECDPRNNHHPIPFPLSQLLLTKSQNNCRPRLVIQIRPIQVRPIQVRAIQVRPPLRSEEHTSELQSQSNLVCRLLLEKKKRPGAELFISMPPKRRTLPASLS